MSHRAHHRESIYSSCLDVGLIPCRWELLAPAQPLLAKLLTLYNLEDLAWYLRWECLGANVLETPKLAELSLSRGQAGPALGAVSLLTLCPSWSEQAPRPPGINPSCCLHPIYKPTQASASGRLMNRQKFL